MAHRSRRGQKKHKQRKQLNLSYEIQTIGLPPGALISMPGTENTRIECLRYNAETHQLSKKLPMLFDFVQAAVPLADAGEGLESQAPGQPPAGKDSHVHWINIENPSKDVLTSLIDYYGIHPLVLEDIQNPVPRPKIEEYSNHLYVTATVPVYSNGEPDRLTVPLICGGGYVISFFKQDAAILGSLRSRILNDQGRIRRMGADYLLFAILDEAVDRSFPFMELMESSIEDLEEEILNQANQECLSRILATKREISGLRHYIWPLSEVISSMHRTQSKFITNEVRVYLRDIADHGLHLIDSVNTLRDMAFGLLDLYHSASSTSMNKVMKVLTLISTIFIPLTFVVGVYGMNFENMPELKVPWAYPAVMGFMFCVAVGQIILFKVKKWI